MRFAPARAAVLGALFSAMVTLPGLGAGTLWDNSETAYGEVAREILLTHDWVVMHFNGQPWFVQPPLYFWVTALFASVLGAGATAMRLCAALATIAMGAATAGATARFAGGRAGVVAGLVLATSLMQAIVGRLAIMDALLDLCVAAGILWWYRALEPAAGPERLVRAGRATPFVLGAVAVAFGTLAKGPVAPVVAVLVIGVWLVWENRAGNGVVRPRRAAVVLAALLFLAIVLPWFVAEAIRVGPAAAGELLGHYTVGRYTGVIENQRGPWWYYVPALILGLFPWIAFVPVALVAAFRAAGRRDASLLRLALVWAIVPVVFFSFAQTKLPNYVALVLPAFAILVALWFEDRAERGSRRAAIVSAATIPLLVAGLWYGIEAFIRSNRLEIANGFIVVEFRVLVVVLLVGSLATLAAVAIPRALAIAPYVLGATAATFILFVALVAAPAAERLKPVPGFARTIEAERTPATVVAVRDVAGSNALLFYTRPPVRTLEPSEADFVALACASPDLFVVTRAADADALVAAARARGRDGSVVSRSSYAALLRVDGPSCTGASPASR